MHAQACSHQPNCMRAQSVMGNWAHLPLQPLTGVAITSCDHLVMAAGFYRAARLCTETTASTACSHHVGSFPVPCGPTRPCLAQQPGTLRRDAGSRWYIAAHLSMPAFIWALKARPWLQALGRGLLALGHCLLSLAATTHLLHCCLQKFWMAALLKALFWEPCMVGVQAVQAEPVRVCETEGV